MTWGSYGNKGGYVGSMVLFTVEYGDNMGIPVDYPAKTWTFGAALLRTGGYTNQHQMISKCLKNGNHRRLAQPAFVLGALDQLVKVQV